MEGTVRYNFKIFIVDDDEMIRSLYQQHLENMGYSDISLFENGQDCLRALLSGPEVVFLDHDMVDMTGFEVLKEIKHSDPDVYVVFVSGGEDVETAALSLRHGAFDYITKGQGDLLRLSEVLWKIQDIRETFLRNR